MQTLVLNKKMNIFVAELRGNGIFFVICTRFEGIHV